MKTNHEPVTELPFSIETNPGNLGDRERGNAVHHLHQPCGHEGACASTCHAEPHLPRPFRERLPEAGSGAARRNRLRTRTQRQARQSGRMRRNCIDDPSSTRGMSAHRWMRLRPERPLGFDRRQCMECGTAQQITDEQNWGRIVARKWRPLAGRCKPISKQEQMKLECWLTKEDFWGDRQSISNSRKQEER